MRDRSNNMWKIIYPVFFFVTYQRNYTITYIRFVILKAILYRIYINISSNNYNHLLNKVL